MKNKKQNDRQIQQIEHMAKHRTFLDKYRA